MPSPDGKLLPVEENRHTDGGSTHGKAMEMINHPVLLPASSLGRAPSLMKKSQSTPALDLEVAAVRIDMSKAALGRASAPVSPPSPMKAPPPPAIISWKGLVVGLRSINKVLLNNISCQITTGYWAIMG